MRTTNPRTTKPRESESARGKILLGVLGVFGTIAIVALVWHRTSPPNVGSDKKVLQQVDALFTAVRVKDSRLLDRCATQLADLKAKGELPDDAATTLTQIVATAHSGDWQGATENLLWFIQGQSANRRAQEPSARSKS
ncbi:MAG TPA: hypothetical protein VMJ32_08845 [Pirellulales bacterium]|nr:hypothetical protein [Pirellulales bacterium]